MTRVDVGLRHVEHSALYMVGDSLCLRLRSRRYLPSGSVIRRSCWCLTGNAASCPVHVLWNFFCGLDYGSRPFAQYSPHFALTALRCILHDLGTPEAAKYRTHDLRRGHAQDLRESGAPLVEILLAGQWRSPAFMQYLDIESLEEEAVLEATLSCVIR